MTVELVQDLSSVLKSLDDANLLAQRLKRRSEQMLDILASEISTISSDIEAKTPH